MCTSDAQSAKFGDTIFSAKHNESFERYATKTHECMAAVMTAYIHFFLPGSTRPRNARTVRIRVCITVVPHLRALKNDLQSYTTLYEGITKTEVKYRMNLLRKLAGTGWWWISAALALVYSIAEFRAPVGGDCLIAYILGIHGWIVSRELLAVFFKQSNRCRGFKFCQLSYASMPEEKKPRWKLVESTKVQ